MANMVEEDDSISICRVCMNADPNLYPIFEVQTGFENSIAEILTECTKYPVERNDKLPTRVCLNCRETARSAHNFKRQTEEAYCRLKSLYDINWATQQQKDGINKETPTVPTTTTGPNIVNNSTSSCDSNRIAHKYTQTEKSTVFQCESCPLKFFVEHELRQHRASTHIYDGKKCRVCGEKFNHLGQLKVHLSTAHPDEGIRCDFKCYICAREFTRKDHLKRHLIKVHKIKDDKLNISKISLDEPEIQINASDNQATTTTLNNYSSHWPDYCNEDDEADASTSQNETAETAINPFSSDDEANDPNNFNNMNDEDVKNFVENFPQPEISIKVEHTDDNNDVIKTERLIKLHEDGQLEDTKPTVQVLESQKPELFEGKREPGHIDNDDEDDFHYFGDDHHSDDDNSSSDDDEDFKHENSATTTNKVRKPRRRHGSTNPEDNRCKECNRTFTRYNHLLRHMLSHSNEKPHICKFCSKGFTRSDHLQKHIQSIHAEKNFKCDRCDNAYGRKDHLMRHIETRHNKNPSAPKPQYECDMCEKKFTTKTYLVKHKLLHTDRLYACKHCPETFTEKEQMKEHQKKEHTQPRNFLCSICGDSFQRNEYLKIHMRRHTGEKPYKCRFCEKGFPRSTDLKMHERYHIGLKPNLCNLCGKGFHRPYNLTIHMRTHTGEKPYKCNQCPQAFAQSNDLKAHIRRHTGERFRCDICSAAFLQRYGLNAHLRTVHGIVVTSFTGRLRKAEPGEVQGGTNVSADDMLSGEEQMQATEPLPQKTIANTTTTAMQQQHIDNSSTPPLYLGQHILNPMTAPLGLAVAHAAATSMDATILPPPHPPPPTQMHSTKNSNIQTEYENETENIVSQSNEQHSFTNESMDYMDSNSYYDENNVGFMDSYSHQHDDNDDEEAYEDDDNEKKNQQHFDPTTGIMTKKQERLYRELYSHLLDEPDGSSENPTPQRIFTRNPSTNLFHCDMCSLQFKLLRNIKRHMLTHTDLRPFQCEFCEKSFKRKDILQKHLRDVHRDPATNCYHCDLCSLQFKMQRNIKRHMLTHTDLRPFECQLCEKTFKRKDNLQKHLRDVHSEKHFECSDCDKKFGTYKQLDRHLETGRHKAMANTKTKIRKYE
ncbi:zinc finger protein 91-like [Musca vetustissima]|uniref:zinc finger protein 91-like n=1 Tax=Musca vetustissima TaxID=27455 RepID=UPI002AB73DA7|nr:zinc finger protein 91-like [Musca vetustissima]